MDSRRSPSGANSPHSGRQASCWHHPPPPYGRRLLAVLVVAVAVYNFSTLLFAHSPIHGINGLLSTSHPAATQADAHPAVHPVQGRERRLAQKVVHFHRGETKQRPGTKNHCAPEFQEGQMEYPNPNTAKRQAELPLWWMAPFFDGSTTGKEATNTVLGAVRSVALNRSSLWLGTTQQDCNYGVDTTTPSQRDDFYLLDTARRHANKCMAAVVVCNSLPLFWARPKNKWSTCQPCPPVGYTPAVTIGRVMAHTDTYHAEFVEYCNRMDEVWVPSQFSLDVLNKSGVHVPMHVLPIPVNTTLYDPRHVEPLTLPVGNLTFGRSRRASEEDGSTSTPAQGDVTKPTAGATWKHAVGSLHLDALSNRLHQAIMSRSLLRSKDKKPAAIERRALPPYTFVSTLQRWDIRHGWDTLLAAYLKEFTSADNVELYILIQHPSGSPDLQGQVQSWAQTHLHLNLTTQQQRDTLPTVYMIDGDMAQEQYTGLYQSADAFVSATRGDGWGLPLAEAMSMGLPVVATNWGGHTAFVDEKVGYMVEYKMAEVPVQQPWWLGRGAKWAEPDVGDLCRRLREVYTNPHEAAQKGRMARQRMVQRYSSEVVGRLLAAEYTRVKNMVRNGTCLHCQGKKWVAPPGDFALDLYNGQEGSSD